MNRQEIIEAYNLPRLLQSDSFKEGYRALRNLVANKDRAYMRLVRGEKAYRRAAAESASASVESGSAE